MRIPVLLAALISVSLTANGAGTTTTLGSSNNPSTFGHPVTLTALVSALNATGSVTFYDGVTPIGTRAVANGQAVLTTSLLASGVRKIKAFYGGDAANAASTSATLTQRVTAVAGYGFRQPVSYPSGGVANDIAVGDLNGDGFSDLVSAGAGGVSIFLGRGDGTFASAVSYPVGNAAVQTSPVVAIADFDGDGKPDVLVAYRLGTDSGGQFIGTLNLLRGRSDGTLQAAVTTPISGWPQWLSVADFNEDGRADLAAGTALGSQFVCPFGAGCGRTIVYLNNGDGTFRVGDGGAYPSGGIDTRGLATGDFNGDGHADVAVLSGTFGLMSFPGHLLIYSGRGDGTLGSVVTAASLSDLGMVSTDLNGDGVADLATNQNVFYGNVDGSFQAAAAYSGGETYMATGDFDADGKADLAAVGNSLKVILGNGGGPLTYSSVSGGRVVTGDFNGDGRVDVALLNGNNVVVLLSAPATSLAFTTQPVDTPVCLGVGIGPVVVGIPGIGASDLIPSNATVNLTSSPAGMRATAPLTNAGATFNHIAAFAGTTVTLIASATGLATAQSNPFKYVESTVGNPLKLGFIAQPTNGYAGIALPTVAVQLQDLCGYPVPFSPGSITVASTPAGVTSAKSPVSGGAVFSDLVFSTPGSYRLAATATGVANIAGATSQAFTIAAANTQVVSGRVTVGGAGVSGVTVHANGTQTLSTTTDASGNYSFVLLSGGSYTISAALGGYSFSGPIAISNLSTSQSVNLTGVAAVGLAFYPVAPCRVADTRTAAGFTGAFGAPRMAGGEARTFPIPLGSCGLPVARAYSLNVTAQLPPKGTLGVLVAWPSGQARPDVSTLNSYIPGGVVANAAIVPADANGSVSLYVSDATDVVIDVNGYFAPPGTGGLGFYPLTPCRIADTRPAGEFTGAFGPPSMTAGSQRTFPVAGNCGIPGSAAAYSLNFTAQLPPQGILGFLSVWPAGGARPNVSTLNNYTPGGVVEDTTLVPPGYSAASAFANAAIVSAGAGGAINVYASDTTDLLFDTNGYFGAISGSGLKYYPVPPCRVADTRQAAGFGGPFGPPSMAAESARSFPLAASSCGIPGSAAAYSLNVTALPPARGALGVLTIWPAGQTQPNASTLNSYVPGSVVSNAAIVPASADGQIRVYVSHFVDLMLDVNGYFAP